jgi:hypothetical protein
MKHYNVVIATPGFSMDAEYVKALMATCERLVDEGISFTFLSEYSSFVPHAREATAMGGKELRYDKKQIAGGKFTYDKIFWIDSDIVWTPEDFLKLYFANLDIVSGLYLLDDEKSVPVQVVDGFVRLEKANVKFLEKTFQAGAVGFGFVCIKSGVFESMPRPWFKLARLNRGDERPELMVGEDFSWCYSAIENGFKIWVDATVQVTHRKIRNLKI